MLLATVTVASLGAWLVWEASRSADDDAQRTFAEFIAEHTRRPPQPARLSQL